MARKILLADDSVTAQNMGRKILADAGYEVVTVNNGSAALKRIAESKPDVIVLDVYMPGYSGLEVCQRLKEAQETARIPILLTVGKLEPFKPEEARRVKAEGFIVKPFEASELLAALTKLEDKIVPRPEASKPGRFARANAAIEESRYGMPAEDEDSGWKDRIRFPSKGKKAPEPEPEAEPDEAALYNPVNKDLRTTVERTPLASTHAVPYEQQRVDLGALVPEGLPKDVTPEEIAALAAAAAQVKARVEEGESERSQEQTLAVETHSVEAAVEAKVEPQPIATEETKAVETVEEPKPAEVKAEVVEAAPVEPKAAEAPEPVATFAVRETEQPLAQEAADSDASTIAVHQPEIATAAPAESSEAKLDLAAAVATELPAEPPMTMAAAAGAGTMAAPSHWKAVAVALAPEEASISLELEMARELEKATHQAAVTAIEASPVPEPEKVVESASATAVAAPVIAPENTAEEIIAPVATLAEPAPSASETHSEPAPAFEATPEPAPVAVKQFEKVSVLHGIETESSAPTSVEEAQPAIAVQSAVSAAISDEPVPAEDSKPFAAEAAIPAAEPVSEEVKTASQAELEPVSADVEKSALDKKESDTAELEIAASEPAIAVVTPAEDFAPAFEPTPAEPERPAPVAQVDEPVSQPAVATAEELVPHSTSTFSTGSEEETAAAAENENIVHDSVPAAETRVTPLAKAAKPAIEPTATERATRPAVTPGSFADIVKKESEIAATTAAAWASWRRIREADRKPAQPTAPASEVTEEPAPPPDVASMAVAAGAEKTPEQSSPNSEDSPEIANLVETVLADLRPKIVEEISRKLGKKK